MYVYTCIYLCLLYINKTRAFYVFTGMCAHCYKLRIRLSNVTAMTNEEGDHTGGPEVGGWTDS